MKRLIVGALLVLVGGSAGFFVLAQGAGHDPSRSPLSDSRQMAPAAVSLFEGRIKPVPELVERDRLKGLFQVPVTTASGQYLEEKVAPLRNSRERTPSGLWKLTFVYLGQGWERLGNIMEPEAYAYTRKGFEQWRAEDGKSPTPYIAYAMMLQHRVSRTLAEMENTQVKPADLEALQGYVRELVEFLDNTKKAAAADPFWYALAVRARSYDCTRSAEVWPLLEEAATRFPDFGHTYMDGSWTFQACSENAEAEVEKIARFAAEKTRDTDGDAYYARVYWSAANHMFGPDLRHASEHIDWARMQRGMRDLMKRYPDPWNANNLALFACASRDAELARELLPKARELPVLSVWRDEKVFASCWQWANATASKQGAGK